MRAMSVPEKRKKSVERLIKAKLELWNAASEVEKWFAIEIDTGAHSELEELCICLDDEPSPEDVRNLCAVYDRQSEKENFQI